MKFLPSKLQNRVGRAISFFQSVNVQAFLRDEVVAIAALVVSIIALVIAWPTPERSELVVRFDKLIAAGVDVRAGEHRHTVQVVFTNEGSLHLVAGRELTCWLDVEDGPSNQHKIRIGGVRFIAPETSRAVKFSLPKDANPARGAVTFCKIDYSDSEGDRHAVFGLDRDQVYHNLHRPIE
ncbi:hypothetical protein [Tateyamaria omphalii]|uniref:hypothetical protein n=1 Tax=Tateyamaria omphalii TaxID=299262 RepID=UPI001675D452|nr:hypothetical protein [Tateyamaria omphalii]